MTAKQAIALYLHRVENQFLDIELVFPTHKIIAGAAAIMRREGIFSSYSAIERRWRELKANPAKLEEYGLSVEEVPNSKSRESLWKVTKLAMEDRQTQENM